jgi:hypothetical protein
MEKCFDRRKLCLGINPAVFQHFLHFLVAFVRLVQASRITFVFTRVKPLPSMIAI